ncbi:MULTISPECIES: hypothetical protein [Echinicola]|uniref:Putative membrane protein n=1 Tax=Echinicola vietnamensis (strain DSM 17526 / LMG 23754 / KMM 6221) TaxID=926556 RepID=L0G297_ECHVK|nr:MULTISPECIES: hypothetical protein [Echinicola]AGA79438.1 putative membrane protein [Echinicola vietnamensis DSM 17526]
MKLTMKNILKAVVLVLFTTATLSAHDGHKNKQDSTAQQADTVMNAHSTGEEHKDHTHASEADSHDSHPQDAHYEKKVTADLADFPTIHPLIVHFAIVLLIVGAILAVVNIFFIKRELAWTAFAMVLVGFVAAYLAGRNFHPHTHGLTEHAKLVLEQHDFWADWTINLGFIGLLLQGINLFIFKSKRWAMAIVAVVLLSAAYAVAHAGHYGAQLVHIEGVGPEGKFLELEHDH